MTGTRKRGRASLKKSVQRRKVRRQRLAQKRVVITEEQPRCQ
jgi:hypothetical protein